MKRVSLLFGFFLIVSLTGCSKKDVFRISGVVREAKGKSIYLYRVEVDNPILIDSVKINSSGSFRFRVKSENPDFYQLGLSKSNFVTLLSEPGERIKLVFHGKNLFEKYDVTGSSGSSKIRDLDMTLRETRHKLDSLSEVYKKESRLPGFETRGRILEKEYTDIIDNQRKYNIGFIINNINSMASIKAIYQRIDPETYVLYQPRDLQYLKIVTDSLTRRYPNSKNVQALARDFEKEMSQMYMRKIESMAKDLPQTTLDPVLTDISGRRIALSSLRGKYVLLSFWSLKSNDCIEENLQFKELYKNYSKRGFEIYQINLDANEAEWRNAVRFDELPWISTREDDIKDPKNAILFNVKSLPANYLFDKGGNIVGVNLHGRALKVKLSQIFNQ